MILQYLGTGAAEGIPGVFCACKICETSREKGGKDIRTRSQAIVYANALGEGNQDERLLIDLPPDTYLHVVRDGLRMERIGHLLITHSHSDHFYPTELQFRKGVFANPNPAFPLNIYGNETVYEICTEKLYDPKYDSFNFHIVENFKPFSAGVFTVTPLTAAHARNERCLIYMIELGGKRILYGNDTGFFPEETWDYIAGKAFDFISLDCTFCGLKEGKGHMGVPDIIEVEARLKELGCLTENTQIVIHHFSHNGGLGHDELVELADIHGYGVSYDGSTWVL